MADEQKPTLLPCPFCGGADCYVERGSYGTAYVTCNDCGARSNDCDPDTPEDVEEDDKPDRVPGETAARRHWNRRAPPAATVEVTVPDRKLRLPDDDPYVGGYADGWNACRSEMLAALARQPQETKAQGDQSYHGSAVHRELQEKAAKFHAEIQAADAVRVQACRPEDRAMLATPEGQEMLKAAIRAMADLPDADAHRANQGSKGNG